MPVCWRLLAGDGRPARREYAGLLTVGGILLVLSGISPYDRLTWLMEIFPILIVVPLLVVTRHRFPLTQIACRLIFLHALFLMLGGHYIYANVPLGFWIQDLLDLSRNHYDRIGHFMQGFVPAIVSREVLLRTSPLRPGRWLFAIVVAVCLALSAFYEFIEWWAALIWGTSAEAFLGTQGDVWDTQWDMFLAFIAVISAQLLLSRLHDQHIKRLTSAQ
jgi:putative membrane protein